MEPPPGHELRDPFVQDERPVGQLCVRVGVEEPAAVGPEPLTVKLRVDRVGAGGAAMELLPQGADTGVVGMAAEGARTVARREGRCLVEEEELGEPTGLLERPPVPAAELEPAGDPAPRCMAATDRPRRIVETARLP